LAVGDVIISINGTTIDGPTTIIALLRAIGPGGRAEIQYKRDGTLSKVTVILEAPREE
jgi:S1-C subfamily serine protease